MKNKSEKELSADLGTYVSPAGLYEHTRALPFLGRISCPVTVIEAGSWQELVLDFEVGASGLADGAWIKVTFKFYSDWALFQTTDPAGPDYVSAEYQAGPCLPGQSPATVQSLKVRFEQKGHERPFQKAVIVDVVDGYLKAGDHIVIRLGDRRAGGPGTRVQTFVEQGFRFRAYIDPLGTSRFSAIPGDVVMDVVAGVPARVTLTTPRLVTVNATRSAFVRAEDRWGNTCTDLAGQAVDIAFEGATGGSADLEFPPTGFATLRFPLPTAAEGALTVTATLRERALAPEQVHVTIDPQTPETVYFGDLHVHSDDTVGVNSTVYNLGYGKEVAGLDVLGYTANDFQITQARWDQAVSHIHEINEDGVFVCYPGTEWCGNSCAGGDHNVIFLHDGKPEFPIDRHGEVCRSFEWNEDMGAGGGLEPGAWPIEQLYATYAHDPDNHLLMPHVGGRRCNLDWHYPPLERLIEVGSAWGQFPWLYEEAIARGYRMGVSANGDEHRGRCGGGVPGSAVFGTRGGLTGILAARLDRRTIGQALRARHTFATTGERLVALARVGTHVQGDDVRQRGAARVNYRFLGDRGWDEIAAYDHTGCVFRRNLHAEQGWSARRVRLGWGGARIRDRYRAAVWNGRVTITGAVVHRFEGVGFEHPEESCWREDQTTIAFRSETYGDIDGIDIELSDLGQAHFRIEGRLDGYVKLGSPRDGNPFVHCPTFVWEISGADLLAEEAGRLAHPLGGVDLGLVLERRADGPLPTEVVGEWKAEPVNGPDGCRPVFFVGTESGGARAWTSALFIEFA